MFTKMAEGAAHFAGHPSALLITVIAVVLGFLFLELETVNITISIVSLLLLLLIQASVNRDSLAVEAKLDDIILKASKRRLNPAIVRLSEEQDHERLPRRTP